VGGVYHTGILIPLWHTLRADNLVLVVVRLGSQDQISTLPVLHIAGEAAAQPAFRYVQPPG
jgi:hypothetical protein